MKGFDEATFAFYQSRARTYIGHRPDCVADELPPFLALLRPGARILELGCGGGQDAAHMIERGFAVHATDGVPAMAAAAERRIGRSVKVMRFDELAAIEDYDAVVALASLLHVQRNGLVDVLARVWRALKPGGLHLATFKTGEEPGYDTHGRYYNYPSRADSEAIYRSAGAWAALDFDEHMGTGYFSAPARWLTVLARKAG